MQGTVQKGIDQKGIDQKGIDTKGSGRRTTPTAALRGLLQAVVFGMLLASAPLVIAQELAPININTADAELLTELPGIGPSRAAAIIDEREANGAFTSADDLARVSGIGPATVDGLKEQVTF